MHPTRHHILIFMIILLHSVSAHAGEHETRGERFPPPLETYGDSGETNLLLILSNRIERQPMNLWATMLFFGAIIHTFLVHRFLHLAHKFEKSHANRHTEGKTERTISVRSRLFHFLGELEAVFGIWVLPLILVMNLAVGGGSTLNYIEERVDFTEAIFVVVIMTVASTRPILQVAESLLRIFARLGNETATAWWFSILLIGPLLGSLITEPAAMTICALLLSQKFYSHRLSRSLAYGSLGLLFVTVSIGGTMTSFAAPPIIMVADAWGWNSAFMLTQFGWKAMVAIILSVAAYGFAFRKELRALTVHGKAKVSQRRLPIPFWVTAGHVLFMIVAVIFSHESTILMFLLLFFLAFVEVTEDFQEQFSLRAPILVGFFLAGLVIHGGLQQWWIAPLLGSLGEFQLMLGSTILTMFNDNAAITYLCTLVPTFTDGMKYAAVAGAVTGGGLTVIANAPNPAGASILADHFEDGISAPGLFAGALLPTLIAGMCYLLL